MVEQSNMKVFKVVQRHYATLGISASNRTSNFKPSKKRIVFGFLLFGGLIVSNLVYTFYVANGFMEYMECICATSATIIIFICFAAIVYRRTLLFENIDNIEKLIDTSEPISNYYL